MIGMRRERKALGFIDYNGGLKINKFSPQLVLRD